MIIDCHCHAYPPEDVAVLTERLSLLDAPLEDRDPNKWILRTGGTVPELIEEQRLAGVDRFVLLPVASGPHRVEKLNEWVAARAAEHPQIIPFGAIHPHGDQRAALDQICALGIKGLKLHPFLQRFKLNGRRSMELLGHAQDLGLPVLLDTMFDEGLVRCKPHMGPIMQAFGLHGCGLDEMLEAARRFPRLKIIAAHGGLCYGWDRIEPLYAVDNIYFDLSFIGDLISREQAVEMIRGKGADRVLYGSDAPWRVPSLYRRWMDSLDISPAEREMIDSGTLLSLLP